MERVILVGLRRRGEPAAAGSLEELARLVETAEGAVAGTLTQTVDRPNPRTLIGPGKAAELAAAVHREAASTVVFDEELTPGQQRNLEELVGAKIVDRTGLILDIFARRARTREGGLQVELAQLEYRLPRLTGKGAALMQQTGGIGTRGPGERKLEVDRRRIRDRIVRLKGEIEGIRRERATQRKRRGSVPMPTVALVGYTNAGKSTLLNRLSGARVYADDRLFATLDPTTRRVKLPEGGAALFTDTVGFIQKLPTSLVASFRATLEEITLADCLVHVVDASDLLREEQMGTVRDALKELGAQAIPTVTAMNKADRLPGEARAALGEEAVSALTGEGLERLLRRVEAALSTRWVRGTVSLRPEQLGLLPEVYRTAQVLGESRRGGTVVLEIRATEGNHRRLKARLAR